MAAAYDLLGSTCCCLPIPAVSVHSCLEPSRWLQNGNIHILAAQRSNGQQLPLCTGGQPVLVWSERTGYCVLMRHAATIAVCRLVQQQPKAPPGNGVFVSSYDIKRLLLSAAGTSTETSSQYAGLQLHCNSSSGSSSISWQLQHQCFTASCKGLQQLPGTVTACSLLVHSGSTAAPNSTAGHLQQVLGAVLQQTAGNNTIAEAAVHLAGAPASESLALHLLAVSAAAAAAGDLGSDEAAVRYCSGKCDPLLCSNALYEALVAGLAQQGSNSDSRLNDGSTAAAAPTPACVCLAGTSSGQVWLCSPCFALLGRQSTTSSHSSKQQPQQVQQQLSLPQPQQKQAMHAGQPRLLLNLHQPIVELLPVSSSTHGEGTPAVLVVGQYGRLVLLHGRQHMQSTGAAAAQHSIDGNTSNSDTSRQCGITLVKQQLPFTVRAAVMLSNGLLLLQSTAGDLHVADVSAAAMLDAAKPSGFGSDGTAAVGQLQLNLQPVKLQLPGKVTRLWHGTPWIPCKPGDSAHSIAHSSARSSSKAAASESSSVIVGLADSDQLLEIGQHVLSAAAQKGASDITVPGSRSSSTTSSLDSGDSNSTAAAHAAAATRRRVQNLVFALESLAHTRMALEQAVMKQDQYLTSIGQDIAALSSPAAHIEHQCLGQDDAAAQAGVTRLPAAAAAAAAAAEATAVTNLSRQTATQQAIGSATSQLLCDIELQGVWPAPAAAVAWPLESNSSSNSSSLHMMVTVRVHLMKQYSAFGISSSRSCHIAAGSLQQPSSSGTSGLGPGWQLLVSFMPESAHTPSWQTTIPLGSLALGTGGNDSSMTLPGSAYAAQTCSGAADAHSGQGCRDIREWTSQLLLPLPAVCVALSEGGWLHVYAMKQQPFSRQGWDGLAPTGHPRQQPDGRTSLLPAVTLLKQQHVSTLQLSRLITNNPAAVAVSANLVKATSSVPLVMDPVMPLSKNTGFAAVAGRLAYTCIMNLQAAPCAPDGQPADVGSNANQQQQQLVPEHVSNKRPRTSHQQHTLGPTGQSSDTAQRQQQQQPFGWCLAAWLNSVIGVSTTTQARSIAQRGLEWLQLQPSLALLQRSVWFNLGPAGNAQAVCAAKPQLPGAQQQQHGSSNPSTAAASKGADMWCSDRLLPVHVAVTADSVPALAQLHRAIMLAAGQALLASLDTAALHSNTTGTTSVQAHPRQQLQLHMQEYGSPRMSSQQQPVSGQPASHCCSRHSRDNSSSRRPWGRWCIVTDEQQLRDALQRLRQLQLQLMRLQDMSCEVLDLRESILAAIAEAVAVAQAQNSAHTAKRVSAISRTAAASAKSAAQGTPPGASIFSVIKSGDGVGDGAVQDVADMRTYLQQVEQWRGNLCAAYGRLLLAAGDAASLLCQDGA